MLVSVVIRTLNEASYLDELLGAITSQIKDGFDVEVVIIDSGSTDGALSVAERHGFRITFITKEEFTFGRSLNRGSEFAYGDILVYISGHCVPSEITWLIRLIKPIRNGTACYTYGRQIGRDTTKYSEEKSLKNTSHWSQRIRRMISFVITLIRLLIEKYGQNINLKNM